MSARALLSELRERGVELAANGDQLRYRPKEDVGTELLDRLKAHKPRLLKLLAWEQRKLEAADRRGLIIKWAKERGWIALHDPLTGEWHEVRASECLPGVVKTADRHRKRRGQSVP